MSKQRSGGHKKKKSHRRHPSRRRKSSESCPSLASDEKLILPSKVRRDVKKVLISAIDEVAEKLKQIPRASASLPKHSTSDTNSFEEQQPVLPRRETLGNDAGTVEKKTDEQRRCNPGAAKIPEGVASSPMQSSNSSSRNACTECGGNSLALPRSHGVFPASELIFCHDRYFDCKGKSMYTRQLFTASGAPLHPNLQKLNELRGEQSPAIPVIVPSNSIENPSSSMPIGAEKLNTVVIENIENEAKGLTLKLVIKMVKPDGTPKAFDLAIDMPDFEPSFVRIGDKTAFLE